MPMSSAIKQLREKLGWSREKMAGELGVSFFSLQKWELGITKPSRLAQREIDRLISTLAEKGEIK